MKSILSGDPSQIAKTLAPQFSAAQQQASQAKKTTAEFGTRSGGTAASNASTDASTRSNDINLVGNLTGTAASNLGSMGTSLLGTGISGTQTAFGDATTLQKERAAKLNDIIASSAQVASGVMGALPAGAGSFADMGGNFAGAFA